MEALGAHGSCTPNTQSALNRKPQAHSKGVLDKHVTCWWQRQRVCLPRPLLCCGSLLALSNAAGWCGERGRPQPCRRPNARGPGPSCAAAGWQERSSYARRWPRTTRPLPHAPLAPHARRRSHYHHSRQLHGNQAYRPRGSAASHGLLMPREAAARHERQVTPKLRTGGLSRPARALPQLEKA